VKDWKLGTSDPITEKAGPPSDVSYLPALRLAVPPKAVPQRPFSVLLVDDNHHHRRPLLRALRDQGHSVLHAADGASGEDLFQKSRLEVDALVACADMNRMCGFDLARRLRRVRPEIRVLLMCRRFAGPDEARDARERGYPVIEEPFTSEELCRRLASLLASPRDASCAEQLGGDDDLSLREYDAPNIDSDKEDAAVAAREMHQWNKAKSGTLPTAARRSFKRRRRS
jgi:DNA-binding response OmpR family regulator